MKTKKTKENVTLNIVVGVLLLLLISFVVWWLVNGANNASDDNAKSLDISVVRDDAGITVKNNEESTLTKCKLTLNEKYSTRVETINTQEGTYLYDTFTDNEGTRFSFETTQPESLNISDCKEEPNRFSAYKW